MSSFIGDPTRRTSVVERIAQGSATWIGAAAIVAALVIVAGCSSPPKPTTVSASLQAGAGVNPDLRRRASPIVVRVYELKSAAAFDGADFVSLYERDQATLAAEMGAREEFILRPGETRQWDKTTAPDTKFIGVMAAFRDIERARWKSIVAIKPNVKNTLAIRADDIGIEAKAAK
ncbi:MAG TPA: type VI secretion system lipoprotein TssJ [Albitalea sp.]